MKIPQPTKEQLAIELANLRDTQANWVANDERRRKEFAKAFSWRTPVSSIGFSHTVYEPNKPSWEEIYVQVGKLLVLEELKQKVVSVTPFPFNFERPPHV